MAAKPASCMHTASAQRIQLAILFLASLIHTLLVPAVCHDVGVLMFLHDAFGSPPVLSNWSWAKEPCQPPWFGVKECNQTSGCHTIGDASEEEQNCRVLALDLHSLGLGGTISFVLGDAWRLQFLDLSDNSIGGPLPVGTQGIAKMGDLQYFNVSHNQLNGSIPYDIGYMYSLQTADLSYNNFSGELPASLGVLASGGNLTYLDLTGNQFTGPVPPQLATIPTLKLGSVTPTGQIDLGGNSGLCSEVIPGLSPCPPGTVLPGLNTSQPPLPHLSPGALSPPAPRASVWGSAVLPIQALAPSTVNLSRARGPAPVPAPLPMPAAIPVPAPASGPVPSPIAPNAQAPVPIATGTSSPVAPVSNNPAVVTPSTPGSNSTAVLNTTGASSTPGSAVGAPTGAARGMSGYSSIMGVRAWSLLVFVYVQCL
ncbi:LRR receptor-like serine/threonine-protein kinase FLS2 [Klebsormidium nitens]|uniref:LRR receptor-like serine/threonine-protein kinase FLS2 n=1 Tax=Klebsormidium nitens TaxID=105231 RepID=A0A1Y1HT62_KLENI|nr:LRR receptor-like serine/threonine-protein kinase FLS2 [Klebsormidium nitens]|eukprot:GAQ79018.1 LRR receptor-like serine/threonine-protein kinase FLS2 [Klebsormidium nitens]